MKRVKCYGRAKVNIVESSFTRNFFESANSRNDVRSNYFEEFQKKGSGSFASIASSSDYTNVDSHELFGSINESSDGNLSTYSPCNSRNLRKKLKSVKKSVGNRTHHHKKFSDTSASLSSLDLQPVFNSRAKKTLKKLLSRSKTSVKQRTSKQVKTPAKSSTSYLYHTDLRLSYTKGRSKNLKLFRKGALKRNLNTSRRCSIKKHSSIPIQPSCYEFFENPSSVSNTGIKKLKKKTGGKKKLLINEIHEVSASNRFNYSIAPSFNSKHDSFWAAIQPRWSSINEYSFEIEKLSNKRKKTAPVFDQQHVIKNTSFLDLVDKDNKLLPNDESNSGEIPVHSDGSQHLIAVEKSVCIDEPYITRNDFFSKKSTNLNINSSKSEDSELKTTKDTSENAIVCEKSVVITCPDLVISQTPLEAENTEIRLRATEIVSNLCETVSEKLNVNEVVAINNDENVSKGKSIDAYKEATENKKGSNKHSMTGFSASMTVPEGKRNKENEYSTKNADQIQEYASAKPFQKSKSFYSSTPLTSPVHNIIAKRFPSMGVSSPALQKGLFTTSTPNCLSKAARAEQNQLCNMSRISRLEQQKEITIDSSVKSQRPPYSKIDSYVLPSGRTSQTSFMNNNSLSNQNMHHKSRSCISFSRREQSVPGESCCQSKSCSLFKKDSSIASTSAASILESTLDKLLEFCGQTRIIPFSVLYDWRNTKVRKIGEGSYGEVFTIVQNRISSVIKVVPFSEENSVHEMQTIESVLSEVTVSKCLSELRNNKNFKTRNFNKLKSVRLVQGCYPDQMLIAWDKFSDVKSTYNSRPDSFDDQQMFAIIELEYGGKDMACFILRNAEEAVSVLQQIAISLAIAEEAHLFEHRDLHLGNILVQRNTSKTISYVLRGKAYSIPNHGLVVTIIDFTLSRVLHDGCIFYNDLSGNNSLFDQSGDFQFTIYKETKKILRNNWKSCLLFSNVLWLSYLCNKLKRFAYTRPSSKKHQEGLNYIDTFFHTLLDCESAFECLTRCNIIASIPKWKQGSAQKRALKVKYVDRKSLQKSNLSRYSSVG